MTKGLSALPALGRCCWNINTTLIPARFCRVRLFPSQMAPPELLFYIQITQKKIGKSKQKGLVTTRGYKELLVLPQQLVGFFLCFCVWRVGFFPSCGLFRGKFLKKEKNKKAGEAPKHWERSGADKGGGTQPQNFSIPKTLPAEGQDGTRRPGAEDGARAPFRR